MRWPETLARVADFVIEREVSETLERGSGVAPGSLTVIRGLRKILDVSSQYVSRVSLPRQADSAPLEGGVNRRVTVSVVGPVFYDLVFSGFSGPPASGQEVRTTGLASSPGGIANVAVALARLGLHVELASVFATDAFGRYLWSTLEQEGIDLSLSHRCETWTSPVTVSMSYDADRSMVTYETPAPVGNDDLLSAITDSHAVIMDLASYSTAQLRALREKGTLVVADVSWDPTETWSPRLLDNLALVDLFLPNAVEAMAYTGAKSPSDALEVLAQRTLGTVVVKDGGHGAYASQHGVCAYVPAIDVAALDPTGAGDVFEAAFIYATLAEWPLAERLRFANLCAGLSVQRHGGSLAAPCWEEVRTYCHEAQPADEWNFLAPTLQREPFRGPCTRACPTFSLGPDFSLPGSVPGDRRSELLNHAAGSPGND